MYMYVQVCLCTCSACGTIHGMIIVDRMFLVYLSQVDYLHELRGEFFLAKLDVFIPFVITSLK